MYAEHKRETECMMNTATLAFENVMVPELVCYGLQYESVEGSDLDLQNCIDGYLNGVSVAIRAQFDSQVLWTYTIKKERAHGGETGVNKLARLIDEQKDYPILFLEWYCDAYATELWGYGITLTTNILQAITDGHARLCQNNLSIIHSTLYSVSFSTVHDIYGNGIWVQKMSIKDINRSRLISWRKRHESKTHINTSPSVAANVIGINSMDDSRNDNMGI